MTKRKEIGSEFWDIPVCDQSSNFFPPDTIWFLSGRSALKYILAEISKRLKIRKAALPSWCCESMIEPFLPYHPDLCFYPVYIDQDRILKQDYSPVRDCDLVLVMDYFGYCSSSLFSDFTGTVIRDVTHSLFACQYEDADYYFGSLRKWVGVWTGGFARSRAKWAENDHFNPPPEEYVNLRRKAMHEKEEYIFGRQDHKQHLALFSQAEDKLNDYGIYSAANRDIEAVGHLDVASLRLKRRNNAAQLLQTVKDYAIFPELKDNDCPLFVPILVPGNKRDQLRRCLIGQEIYCPVHWPVSKYHVLCPETKRIYDEELSLVCDQRYSSDDMDRFCSLLNQIL